MPLNENMPDLPDGFSYEALYRAKVHDQETGFEQCRQRVLEQIKKELKEGESSGWDWRFEQGYSLALERLQDWVTGARAELTVTLP